MTQAQDLEREIRGFINKPRKQALLLQDRAQWAKLCSSLDVIGDTELALEAYLQESEPRDTGKLYLLMYGVLQVLYVQQDAVKDLAGALGLPYTRSAAITTVRNTRNDAVGHPSSSQWGKASSFISRITMFAGGFQMLTMSKSGATETKEVNVPELVERQRVEVGKALQEIVTKLKEEEAAHREKFRDTKLVDFFPASLEHAHEKISEAIGSDADGRALGAGMLESVHAKIQAFRSELEKRGLLGKYSSAREFIDELEHPIARLRSYFSEADASITALDAVVFRFFIQEKVNGLAGLAAEIDAEYSEKA